MCSINVSLSIAVLTVFKAIIIQPHLHLHSGCMSRVEVNGRVQDLAESEKQNKVVAGCGDAEQHDQGAIRSIVQATRPPEEEARAAPKAQKARGKAIFIMIY